MPIVVQRSLFKTGDSLAVTLPKAWIRGHHLRPGDKVDIIADDDLSIRAKQNSKHGQREQPKTTAFYRLRFSVLARDGFRCRYCGRSSQEDGVKLLVDQIVPGSKGGTNEPSNLVTCCADCNHGKGVPSSIKI